MKVGRNDPCPCGSGMKYKKCCADKPGAGGGPAETGRIMDELRKLLEGQNFASLDEANVFAGQFMQQRNHAKLDDFHGLSPDQMHRFLNFPFDSPQLVTFPAPLPAQPDAPIMTLFLLLADAIGEMGLKATATGNLPRAFCREAAQAYFGEEEYRHWSRIGEVRTEPDFKELHVTRLVAELAGLVRKYKGKFILSRECRKILVESGPAGIYPRLFRAFAQKFNWGYQDHYPEIPFVQHSFLFSMYLLDKYGSEWKSSDFYEDCFLAAFPQLLHEVPPLGAYLSAEQQLRRCYSLRSLERFAEFFGLVEVERIGKDRYLPEETRLRKLPLLNLAVQFH